ncbi:MAG: hypothetical protein IPM23_06035 [Candidatus Melainabacteria bacterium]|nr:hypothetical protein [Candidatus Melainabacteria bacterium]
MKALHPDLVEQYGRYRAMAVIIALSGTLPLITLIILPVENKVVILAFILQIPLAVVLGYLMGVKRMRYLERASALVAAGQTRKMRGFGPFRGSPSETVLTFCIDLLDESGSVERQWLIPVGAQADYIVGLPALPDQTHALESATDLEAFVDPGTGSVAAVSAGGRIFFVCPPARLL